MKKLIIACIGSMLMLSACNDTAHGVKQDWRDAKHNVKEEIHDND
jgi:predicted small secreted protein